MIPREILKKIRQIELRTNRIVTAVGFGLLLLLCSCATTPHPSANIRATELPADVDINKDASRGNLLLVPLRLESGEELLFAVDTGCYQTILDKSLEQKLGKPLGTKKSNYAFYGNETVGVYQAPKLYLGNTQLLTGKEVVTDDLRQKFPGHSVMGFIGMDCLRHYCIQLDFQACKMRFLNPDHLDAQDLGKAFPLNISFNRVSTHANLFSIGDVSFRMDTGLAGGDFFLKPQMFRWELNKPKPFKVGELERADKSKRKVMLSKVIFNAETYTNIILVGKATMSSSNKLDAASFSRVVFGGEIYTDVTMTENANQSWPAQNWIGLRFLARHLVTFNFPKRIMYLRQTSVGPLVDEEMPSLTAFINGLLENGLLPGLSKKDNGTISLDTTAGTKVILFQKVGDPTIRHYQFARTSEEGAWKLLRAWRTDEAGKTIEEYPVP